MLVNGQRNTFVLRGRHNMDNEILLQCLDLQTQNHSSLFTANILPVMTAEGEIWTLGRRTALCYCYLFYFEPKLWSVTLFAEWASPTLASVNSPEAE